LKFWRAKDVVYSKYIKNLKIIKWESIWAKTILQFYKDTTLEESLLLKESQIIEYVLKKGLIKKSETFRYKEPQRYFVNPPKKRKLENDQCIYSLNDVLVKKNRKLSET